MQIKRRDIINTAGVLRLASQRPVRSISLNTYSDWSLARLLIGSYHSTRTLIGPSHSTRLLIGPYHSTRTLIGPAHSKRILIGPAHSTRILIGSPHSTLTLIGQANGTHMFLGLSSQLFMCGQVLLVQLLVRGELAMIVIGDMVTWMLCMSV